MKKKNLLLILYLICTICFTISGFFPHISTFWTSTGDFLGDSPGPELIGAPFFIIVLILFLTSKIKTAFSLSLAICLIIGIIIWIYYYVYLLMYEFNKGIQTQVLHPSYYIGLFSYFSLLFLTIMMPSVYKFKVKELFVAKL